MKTWREEISSEKSRLPYKIIDEIVDAFVEIAEYESTTFMGYNIKSNFSNRKVWDVEVTDLPKLGIIDLEDAMKAIINKIFEKGLKEARIKLEEF